MSSRALPAHLPSLREQVRGSARNLPGTYRMVAEDGEVLYVGKSKQVRTRLLSYFRAKDREKAARILRDARRLEWEYEPSEFAALLRELELIKRLRPRFNVQHKRDGLYSFLKLSGGDAPRLLVVRQVSDDAATYFGPFRGGRRIADAVRELNDVLGLRDCALGASMYYADQPDLFGFSRTPGCPRFDLQRCLGPCAGGCTEAEYAQRVELARRFLEGRADEPLDWLAERMNAASSRWDFEYAAVLRDRTVRLKALRDDFSRLREALENLSFLYPVSGAGGDDRVYILRRGTVRAVAPAPRTAAQRKRLARLADAVFSPPEQSTTVVARHQVDEILLVARWFRARPEELERTIAPDHSTAVPRIA